MTDRNRLWTATFSQGPTLTVTKAGAGNGTVGTLGIDCGADCSGAYLINTMVTLTATPAQGSTFAGWSGDCSGAGAFTEVFLAADRACTATFDIQTFTLSVGIAGTGNETITSSPPGINCGVVCAEAYATGTVVTLTATPDAGSAFGSWLGCAQAIGNQCTVPMTTSANVIAFFILAPPAPGVSLPPSVVPPRCRTHSP